MGDVDITNFTTDLVSEFSKAILNASFISIDLEMSGITFPNQSSDSSAADSVPLRYHRVSQVAATFGIIQVGVALFFENTSKVYNFYVFPRPVTEGSVNSIPLVTLCSASTNFNRTHGMDFDRWISKGVTYVDSETETKLREAINETSRWDTLLNGFSIESSITSSEEYTTQLEAISKQVSDFVADENIKTMRVPFVHGGQKWLKSILKSIHESYPSLRLIEEVSGGGSCRSLTKKTSDQLLFDYIGFRVIWSQITAANKPVVFHNGMLDLLFCYNSFESKLPESLSAFKKLVGTLFPAGVFDTRLIAIESGISSAALETLAELFRDDPAFATTVVDSDTYSAGGCKIHEAGFDALMTGQVFKALQQREPNFMDWKNQLCVNRCLWVLSLDNLETDRLMLDIGKTRIARIINDINPNSNTRDVLAVFEDLKNIISGIAVNIQWISDTAGVLVFTWSQPADKTIDSITVQINAKLIEIVKSNGKIKISTPNEYIKKQMDEIHEETLISKRFRM